MNGRRILIRGAGWSSDLMLRYSKERFEQEIAYVKDMGLNTIRLEGKLEAEAFFDVTDREGILVMPGWCCCDHWEQWEKWDAEDLPVATASLRDQVLRLRGRASVFTWLNGSDGPPPAKVEQAYLDVLKQLGFPNPVVSSATEKKAEVSGESGMKMRGPYEWVPPLYWYTDTKLGGPHGFATEIGPGPAPPPLESLRRFIPEDKLWPINEVWNYHCGGGPFKTLDVFTRAMDARYGPSKGAPEYARKAQAAAYESHRAMLESFGERKYTATGVIQWMQNNAWPGMIWHLYDFYLRPGGSYFGAKKAGEPLHVQFAYDDRSVVVVNSTLQAHAGLRATARVLDLASKELLARTAPVDVGPDGSVKVFPVPEPPGLTPTYFLALQLDDAAGRTVSRNVYWLSTKRDVLAWDKSEWYVTPLTEYADLTGLAQLPPAEVPATARLRERPRARHAPQPVEGARLLRPPGRPQGPGGRGGAAGALGRQLRHAAAGRDARDRGRLRAEGPRRRDAGRERRRLERRGGRSEVGPRVPRRSRHPEGPRLDLSRGIRPGRESVRRARGCAATPAPGQRGCSRGSRSPSARPPTPATRPPPSRRSPGSGAAPAQGNPGGSLGTRPIRFPVNNRPSPGPSVRRRGVPGDALDTTGHCPGRPAFHAGRDSDDELVSRRTSSASRTGRSSPARRCCCSQ